jgi:hypothetical protein
MLSNNQKFVSYCKDVLKTGEAYEAVEAQKRRNLGLFIALLLIGQ